MKKLGLIFLTLLLSFMSWAESPPKASERPTLTESSVSTDSDLKAMLEEAWDLGYKAAAQKLNPERLAAIQALEMERDLRKAAEVQERRAEGELWPWRIATVAALIVSFASIGWAASR